MTFTLNTVAARAKLKPRNAPYYTKLAKGSFLGYRKLAGESTGTWTARYREDDTDQQHWCSLGAFDHLSPSERFAAAKDAAEAWCKHLGMGGAPEIVSVKAACEEYVAHVRSMKGHKAADDIAARFDRWVYSNTALARIELPKLGRSTIEKWRKGLAEKPVRVNHDVENPVTRPRAPSSINRDMTALRAALNRAHDLGHVTSDLAWRQALKPIQKANGRRDLYLDIGQRRTLLNSAEEDIRHFMQGMALVPLRPGALAVLTVAHFNKRLGVLTVGKDKAGKDRRIALPETTAAFFAEMTKDKLPGAPLLSRANGKPWDKDSWKKPIKAAAEAAELPAEVTAYTLRHSVITDLVTGGLDMFTTAQLSGTSVEMIESHYGHLKETVATPALAALAL